MTGDHRDIWSELASFHTDKVGAHGTTALGAGWNGEASQRIRFEQLAKIFDTDAGFSVYDLGCGYGALLDFLGERYRDFSYTGYDVSEAMIDAARSRHAGRPDASFQLASEPLQAADFGIASGIFSLHVGRDQAEWSAYVDAMLDVLDRTSRRGFAFNSLTTYSDPEKMRDDLYYADPCRLFDRCKRRYSRNVALLHDYDLYDFTILVRKNG